MDQQVTALSTIPSSMGLDETSTRPTIEEVFDALKTTAKKVNDRGRSPAAAGIKTLLAQELGISEVVEDEYGFRTFSELLREAELRGYIVLKRYTEFEGYPDTYVFAEEAPESPTWGSPSLRRSFGRHSAHTIRSDFWAACMEWSPSARPVFDRAEDRAFSYRPEGNAPRDTHLTALVSADDGSRFLSLPKFTYEDQLTWVSQFLDTQTEPEERWVIDSLRATLQQPGDSLFDFARQVRRVPSTFNQWKEFRFGLVVEALEQWKSENALGDQVNLKFRTVVIKETPPATDEALTVLRQLATEAVSEMSADDLRVFISTRLSAARA